MAANKPKHTLRAGQLAKLADVSTATIKHYVNEGLIPKPLKTGKTMAYYDEACVERIKLIKKLQKEKFLPLDVIKRAIDSGAAYEEELELGQAILKSHKMPPPIRPVSEARIERHTGYPLHKIRLLEREGFIFPTTKGGGKYYGATDCSIIDMVKRREELGLPFDHCIELIRLYRDAMKEAVRGDIELFAKNILGDRSTRQTVQLLTEIDDTLDTLVVLMRQKMQRLFSEAALKQMNDIPNCLPTLSFLPVEGTELPSEPPEELPSKLLYLFLTGAYEHVTELIDGMPEQRDKPAFVAADILAHLLRSDTRAALSIAERYFPRPSARTLDNTAAALAHTYSIGETSGFSGPMYLVKKTLGYLKRIEVSREKNELLRLFSQYVCGALLTMLPDIFDTCETGVRLLKQIEGPLRNREFGDAAMPEWLARTLEYEVAPAMELRVNRFLAEGCSRLGKSEEVDSHLERIIEISDAEDEHSVWARLKKVEGRTDSA